MLALMAFFAVFLAIAYPNYASVSTAWYTTFVFNTLRSYAFTWLVALLVAALLMPVFYRLNVHRFAWIFCACSFVAMAINYLLPLGQL